MTVPLPHRLREIVERVSRDRVLRRRMPADLGGGPIYASPDAMLKYWRRDISASDPALLAAAKQLIRPGMRVWDIGANVGIFTFAAQFLAGPSGHVLGVEADPWLVSLLQRSRASRAGTGAVVDFLCAAVSGNAELARFNIAARGRAASALKGAGTTQMGGGTRRAHSSHCYARRAGRSIAASGHRENRHRGSRRSGLRERLQLSRQTPDLDHRGQRGELR